MSSSGLCPRHRMHHQLYLLPNGLRYPVCQPEHPGHCSWISSSHPPEWNRWHLCLNSASGNLQFGSVQVGTSSSTQAFVYSNTGTNPITITAIAENSTSFSETDNCPRSPSTLAAGSNCTISGVFSPLTTGALAATLTVTSSSTKTAALSGTGTAATISLNPATLAFGNVLSGFNSPFQTVTITNSGTAVATLTSIGASAGFVLGGVESDCEGEFQATTPNTLPPHSNVLSWTASPTSGVTYNLYKGIAPGVCGTGKTPYKTGIAGTTYTDTYDLPSGYGGLLQHHGCPSS